MQTTITGPTTIIMSRVCELFWNTDKHFVPLVKCGVKQLADVLAGFPDVKDVEVQFRTFGTPEQQAADLKTCTKRMRTLPPNYVFTGFSPKVINGQHMDGLMTGRLTRCG